MKRFLKVSKDDEELQLRVEDACTFFSRMMGLMFRKSMSDDCALLLTPCNQIHTFSMKFAIDAVYLSQENKIVKIEPEIEKRRICKTVKEAQKTLELTSGTAEKIGLECGDVLSFEATKK